MENYNIFKAKEMSIIIHSIDLFGIYETIQQFLPFIHDNPLEAMVIDGILRLDYERWIRSLPIMVRDIKQDPNQIGIILGEGFHMTLNRLKMGPNGSISLRTMDEYLLTLVEDSSYTPGTPSTALRSESTQ